MSGPTKHIMHLKAKCKVQSANKKCSWTLLVMMHTHKNTTYWLHSGRQLWRAPNRAPHGHGLGGGRPQLLDLQLGHIRNHLIHTTATLSTGESDTKQVGHISTDLLCTEVQHRRIPHLHTAYSHYVCTLTPRQFGDLKHELFPTDCPKPPVQPYTCTTVSGHTYLFMTAKAKGQLRGTFSKIQGFTNSTT